MNHVMAEYLTQTLSEGWKNEQGRPGRLMARELRLANRAARRRRRAG